MRLSWVSLLMLPAFCSSGCEGDSCGPTSEWPTCNSDQGANTNSPDSDNSDGKPKPEQSRDAGKRPVASIDAGVRPLVPDDEDTATGNADDGADGGVPVDASVTWLDGGIASDCTIDSDGRDAGACFGVYCGVERGAFALLSSQAGACHGADDVTLACDGELARVVTACVQDDVLALGFGRTVALCAGRAPSLSKASERCVDCYVDEVLCALEHCLAPCLDGSSRECTECRQESCGLEFRTCSGLPQPH